MSARWNITLISLYTLLAVLLTWPTATQLSTHLPGDGGDDPALAWNLWWLKYALLNEGQNPLVTDMMFYPIGLNLAFYTLTPLNGVTALPLTLNFGVVAASNLHLWLTFALGGYGVYLLTQACLIGRGEPLPAPRRGNAFCLPADGQRSESAPMLLIPALAGLFYTFGSYKLFYVALGQFNIASTQWIPFTVLYLLRTQRAPRRLSNALLTGLFLTLQAWTEMTYASFLLVFIGLFWAWHGGLTLIKYLTGFRNLSDIRDRIRPHVTAALCIGLTFTLGLTPLLSQMLPDLLTEGDFLVEGEGFAQPFSSDLFGFLIPTMLHPLWGDLIRQTSIPNFDKGQHIYLGLTLLSLTILAMLGRARLQEVAFWLTGALLFALLCLGPTIVINGYNTGFDGPFRLLQELPLFRGNRYPSRYAVMLMLCLSVTAAYGLRWGWLRLRRPTLRLILVAVVVSGFLLEHLSTPLPQSDMRLPTAYAPLIADTEKVTVLTIPFAWRNGFNIFGAKTTQFMFSQFYQTEHQKRLLHGNTSRNPAFNFQYFIEAPVINSLIALQTGRPLPDDRWTAEADLAPQVFDFFDIRYLVISPDESPTVTPQATLPYLETVLPLEPVAEADGLTVYRIPPLNPADRPRRIAPQHPLASLYFGEGWGIRSPSSPFVAQRQAVRLLIPSFAEGEAELSLTLRLPDFASHPTAEVWLSSDGWTSARQTVTSQAQRLTFRLPDSAAHIRDVWLHTSRLTPAERLTPPDVTAVSAGHEVGDFGHIYHNGQRIATGELGYTVALLQPSGGLTVRAFNTHGESTASAAMATLLTTAPPDATIVVVATDEASLNLGEGAVRALQQLGSTVDLRGCFRCSHAFIRLPDGRLWEQADPLRPVGLTTRLGLTEPTVAVLLESLAFGDN